MNLELENIGLKKQIIQLQSQLLQAEWNRLHEMEKGLLDQSLGVPMTSLATPIEEEKEISEK